ncbi:GNAT family N-acetyltransferase [Rhizorhabdus histidinilytica]|nr:GNAT family N-acetyltransferase [Rhizorhabdus histidinilytica]
MTWVSATGLTAPMEPSPNLIEWRGAFTNDEVNALHAECFDHRLLDDDWWSQVNRFSLGWVCLRRGGVLIGFVNVAWDGGVHAFVLDTMVAAAFRRQGMAKALIDEAVAQAKHTGCEWLHVDFDPHLRPFYLDACGFTPTDAGLIALR